MTRPFIIAIATFFGFFHFSGDAKDTNNPYNYTLKWSITKQGNLSGDGEIKFLNFEGARFDAETGFIPVFKEFFALEGNPGNVTAQLIDAKYETLTEEYLLPKDFKFNSDVKPYVEVGYERKKPKAIVSFIPIRLNPANGKFEKLVSFTIQLVYNSNTQTAKNKVGRVYADHSVLASGNWYKIGVKKDGIYKITPEFLKNMGMDISAINPQNLRIYGNGGRLLPFLNAEQRTDDLKQLAISVTGESDGVFNSEDYILFYGEGTDKWDYSKTEGIFKRNQHLYSDTNYYFLTADLGAGKRIASQASSSANPTHTLTTYNDYFSHELDIYNLIKSGREWFGEKFDIGLTNTFNYSLPHLDLNTPVTLVSEVAARSDVPSSFALDVNGNAFTHKMSAVDLGTATGEFANINTMKNSLLLNSGNIQISYTYNKPRPTSVGWLNKFEMNMRRQLSFSADQQLFRDVSGLGAGNVTEYKLSNAGGLIQIWDVTDAANVMLQSTSVSGGQLQFKLESDNLHQFIAFNGQTYFSPIPLGFVPNQDLHGLPQCDLLIVTHPKFYSEAVMLADFHKEKTNLKVNLVTSTQIYNEFSSGLTDATAIRDFAKMFYDRAISDGTMPKHLLLFGDGSYDSKNVLNYSSNYIPTYQSANSNTWASSYVSDDFFGILDDHEGTMNLSEQIDLNVGRLPVQTLPEAKAMVDKIIHYGSPAEAGNSVSCSKSGVGSVYGDWRNVLSFVADDKDGNTHLQQTETLTNFLDTAYKNYNVDKIYFDSYVMEKTPGGERFPDVKNSINNRVQKGALIMNYVGHGGEVGWAHERVLEVSDIQAWTNYDELPLFVTATCEFSRFDDPARTSAGELVLLNPRGGGIGLLTTVRVAFSGTNGVINQKFFQTALKPNPDGSMPTMGDIFTRTKNAAMNNRNFMLLGDPALKLAYPQYHIETTTINGKAPGTSLDTLKALDKITVTGFVKDKSGNKMTDFNGILYPTVFDKYSVITTLGNDPSSGKTSFKLRKNMLFKGKASVKNGEFTFTFIVPNDINYSFGPGKISYYAENGTIDANGMFNPSVGGSSSNSNKDETGPEVKLYMNDDKFVYGGITDESPSLYAIISDPNGINTVGNGIGHDIKARLDNSNKDFILNDYYESDLDDYQKGKVIYPFSKLSPGSHKLSLKAWDVYNNSSETNTEFIVAPSAQFALKHVLNYPNPFTTHTQFFFEHNRPCTFMDVQVQIFTVSGKLVKSIERRMTTGGYRSEPIDWDGLDDYGNKIGRGVYVYRVKVRSVDGTIADKFEKLVILN